MSPILKHVSRGSGKASRPNQSIRGEQRPLLARSTELQEIWAVRCVYGQLKMAALATTLYDAKHYSVAIRELFHCTRLKIANRQHFSCLQGFNILKRQIFGSAGPFVSGYIVANVGVEAS